MMTREDMTDEVWVQGSKKAATIKQLSYAIHALEVAETVAEGRVAVRVGVALTEAYSALAVLGTEFVESRLPPSKPVAWHVVKSMTPGQIRVVHTPKRKKRQPAAKK